MYYCIWCFFTKCLFTLKGLVYLSKWVVKLVHFSSKNNFYPLKDKKITCLKKKITTFALVLNKVRCETQISSFTYTIYIYIVMRISEWGGSHYFFLTSLWSSVTDNRVIFAEDKLHSAIWKQAFIALIGIIFAEDKLHSAIWKQAFIALIGIIFVFG